LVWIGIVPEEIGAEVKGAPVLKFAHFLPLPLKYVKLRNHYPALAWVMFDGPNYHRAAFMHSPGSNPGLDAEVAQILELAKDAPPSLWGIDCSLDRRVSC
jgi:hypothetical protein